MYKIPNDIQLSMNLKLSELVCKEGKNEVYFEPELVEMFQKVRDVISKPMLINSGYRSASYNSSIGGSPRSQHIKGRAIDFRVNGMTSQQIFNRIENAGLLGSVVKGIGLYDNFVHIDCRINPHERGWSSWNQRTS